MLPKWAFTNKISMSKNSEIEPLLSHDYPKEWVKFLENMWHLFLCECAEHHPEKISKYYWYHLTLVDFFKSLAQKEVANA